MVPSETVEEVELESQRPKRKGLLTALRSEADTFSAENELEIRYKGEKVTDLSQACLLVSGKMKMCDFLTLNQHCAWHLICTIRNLLILINPSRKSFGKWLQ